MKTRIPYSKPSITEIEVKYATDAALNGWGDRCYDYIHRFEHLFKEHLGVEFTIATSSCTGALHMGMAALGIGPGDEVILADTNWIATAAPIIYLGAKPVFVDIKFDTWCIDPELVEAAITPFTKAIIAVHLYGNLCDMEKLIEISNKYGVPIIEDSAEAIGSVWKSKRAGTMGKFGVFSFHGTKTLTTGEGGMFVTNDSALFERVRTLGNHGRAREQVKQFWPDVVGFKYKMANIQAAIGCGQMERIDKLIARKQQILDYYIQNLKNIPGVSMNPRIADTENGAWMPTVVFTQDAGITREILQLAFNDENVDARVFFWPLSSMQMFESIPSNKNSWEIPNRAINLPSFHEITSDELERIVSVIVKLIGK